MKDTSELGPFPRKLQAELKPIFSQTLHSLAYLDAEGNPLQQLPAFAQTPDELTALYRAMVLIRTLDQKSITLQRTGQLGTYASSMGQEAVAVALGTAMQPDDVLLPSYRDSGALILRGAPLVSILQYWSGDERGLEYGGECPNDFPITLTIGAHTTHAVGVAYALKLRGEGQAAVCSIGEGATSKGDFYEAINGAGVWKLPLVFLVSNNQYAISLHASSQTASLTFAQKAIAAGIPALQVDGNDVFAVKHALAEALDYSRQGGGTLLIEAVTYRLHDHTTADDASRYREKAEVQAAREREPLKRLRNYLTTCGWWNEQLEEELLKESRRKVDAAIEEYRNLPPVDPAALLFDHLYAELPKSLEAQRQAAAKFKHPDSHA